MKVRILSILLICVGISVLCYPKLIELYHDTQQQKLIRQWQESFMAIDVNAIPADSMDEELDDSIQTEDRDKPVNTNEDEEFEKKGVKIPLHEDMEGMLIIDKIDLNLPILHGATEKNLKTTVASIENTGQLGQIGNYAIAGHRNRTYGRNFNRLDELEEGDKIEVNDGQKLYEYTVEEKLYVLPEEVWVLESNEVDKEITLVTCHPIETGTHRLIIKGKMRD